MLIATGGLLFGLLILFGGGHLLVESTTNIAKKLQFQVFFISLLLLGIGTSAPELFVSLQSHWSSESDMAIGNVIGSNIFNILIVAGLSLATQINIQNKTLIIKNISLLLITSLIAGSILLDLTLSRLNGMILLILFCLFFTKPFRPKTPSNSVNKNQTHNWHVIISLLCIGFICLFLGAKFTIHSALLLGEYFDLSKRILGILFLSIGTSLPELALGIVAIIKRNSELAIGGIVGSNVFNTFFIPGLASVGIPLSISAKILHTDGVIMIFSTFLFLCCVLLSNKIPKVTNYSLILGYLFYIYYILQPVIS